MNELNATDMFPGRKLNEYHLSSSIAEIVSWQELLGMGVDFKETAEVEQIRERHIKDAKEIEALKLQVTELRDQLIEARAVEGDTRELKQRMSQIRKLATI